MLDTLARSSASILLDDGRTAAIRSSLSFIGVAVVSADGFIAGEGLVKAEQWASREDFKNFCALLDSADLCVMGRKTHEIYPNHAGRSRVVLTRNPALLNSAQENHVTYINAHTDGVDGLVRHLAQHASRKARVLVLGGTQIYSHFLEQQGLGYDEFFLTIEPKNFGQGLPLFRSIERPFEEIHKAAFPSLREVSETVLNSSGTKLRRFEKVVRAEA